METKENQIRLNKAERDKRKIIVECQDQRDGCIGKYEITYGIYRKRKPDSPPYRCPSCLRKFNVELTSNRYKNMTEEEKIEWGNKTRDRYKNMTEEERKLDSERRKIGQSKRSDEEKELNIRRMHEGFKKYRANLSEEDKLKIAEERKSRWEKLSEEERKEVTDRLYNEGKKWRDSLSEEDKREISLRVKKQWEEMTEEEKEIIRITRSISGKERWMNMSEEELARISNERKEYFASLTDEEKMEWINKRTEGNRNYWRNLSDEERQRRAEISANNVRKAHELFSEEYRKRMGELARQRYENMSKSEQDAFMEHMRDGSNVWRENRSLQEIQQLFLRTAITRAKNLRLKPNELERLFANILTENKIIYTIGFNSAKVHEEFYNHFDKTTSPYHVWDFILFTKDGRNVLVDIDGSIHGLKFNTHMTRDGIDIAKMVRDRDSKRIYQTDGMDAYIVMAYENVIYDDSPVFSLSTSSYISFKRFIEINRPPKKRYRKH